MKRFLTALKIGIITLLVVALLIGVIGLIVGIVLERIGCHIDSTTVNGFLLFMAIGALSAFFYAFRDTIRAICPECQEFMNQTTKPIHFGYKLTYSKTNYDYDGDFDDYSCNYDCFIDCPHCGNRTTFTHSLRSKDPDKEINEYIEDLLK